MALVSIIGVGLAGIAGFHGLHYYLGMYTTPAENERSNVHKKNRQSQSIMLSDSVIGTSAFERCDQLSHVVITPGVVSIGKNAFRYCRKLPEIHIPGSVAVIGPSAFEGCSVLETIEFGDLHYLSDMTEISARCFAHCSRLKQVVIPRSVTKIRQCAFFGCVNLKHIIIPESVVSIGLNAFSGCRKLETVTFLNTTNVVHIDPSAFSNCPKIKTITIPNTAKLDWQLASKYASEPSIPSNVIIHVTGCSSSDIQVVSNKLVFMAGLASCFNRFPKFVDGIKFRTLAGDTIVVSSIPKSQNDDPVDVRGVLAAELGQQPEDIYLVDGDVVLFRPSINVNVCTIMPDGSISRTTTCRLTTEHGAAEDEGEATTLEYATRTILHQHGLWLEDGIQVLHGRSGGHLSDVSRRHVTLADAGIDDGTLIIVNTSPMPLSRRTRASAYNLFAKITRTRRDNIDQWETISKSDINV
eukprot:m.177342 g.177342  ORF g.177342 m.177342 type:complete len:468 (+) comp31885_c0_seq1:274-1677(+)